MSKVCADPEVSDKGNLQGGPWKTNPFLAILVISKSTLIARYSPEIILQGGSLALGKQAVGCAAPHSAGQAGPKPDPQSMRLAVGPSVPKTEVAV